MHDIILAKKVAKIAKKAGDAIMDIYNNSDNFQVQHKPDESPLTIADQAANEIICLFEAPEDFKASTGPLLICSISSA